jgi:N-acetylmuramoyl-L-alanine amidase
MSFVALLLSALLGLLPAPSRTAAEQAEERGGLTIDLNRASAQAAEEATISGPAGRPLVVLDPGHGGRDPGATSPFGGRLEKHLTLVLSRAIRDELLKSGRVRVALTREDDRYVVHAQRYGMARRLGAELFISVHADAAPGQRQRARSDRLHAVGSRLGQAGGLARRAGKQVGPDCRRPDDERRRSREPHPHRSRAARKHGRFGRIRAAA